MILLIVSLVAEAQRMRHNSGSRNKSQNTSVIKTNRQNRSINGGYNKPTTRHRSKQNLNRQPKPTTRDVNKTNIRNKNDYNRNPSTRDRNTNINNRKNVNINNNRNVNVNRNIYVRPPVRPYPRPPYAYGGFRYNCYHPYHYHRYTPYYWGPAYHPWGFFVATLAVTAIIISVNNQQYHYDQGVYYVESNGGYTVVEAPVGATVNIIPEGYQTIVVNETTNNYYYGGTYYEKSDEGYTVVPPTAGTVVDELPEGGEEVRIGEITYVRFGEIYYQPIEVDGKNMYEVVNVEPVPDSE